MQTEASKERKLREHSEVYSKQLEAELQSLKVRGHTHTHPFTPIMTTQSQFEPGLSQTLAEPVLTVMQKLF